jgi:hypothetical protein
VTARGAIVLADISGYTEFITGTELEHSREILAELLGTVCDCAAGTLTVAQLEGDAVFWLGPENDASLIACLQEKFIEFHRRLRFMTFVTTCQCHACVAVGALSLKFVIHCGEYVRQRVGESDHFVGREVVLAHRLLKNHVPSHEYILVTEAALAGVRAEGFLAHEEEVEHFGRVRTGYLELSALRKRVVAERTDHITSAEAQLRFERFFPVPMAALRSRLSSGGAIGGDTSDRIRPRTPYLPRLGIKRLIDRGGARGTPLGSETHCYHGDSGEDLTILRVVRLDREPGLSHSTLHVLGHLGGYYVTQTLREEPSGSRVELLFLWEAGAAERASVPEDFAALVEEDLDRLELAVRG